MKKIIFYSFLACGAIALTYWLSIKYISNSNNLNLPYSLSQPVMIPYPNGVSLGNIESVGLATTAKNTLWVSSQNGLEIDLNKKQSALFVRKYGLEKLHSAFNFSEKQIDKTTNDYWFSSNTKTYRYNLLNKKMQTYDDVGSFLTLFRDNEQLWLGTTQGLFKYNEASDLLIGVAAICNVQVKSIEKESKDLIINDLYKYNETENKVENVGVTYILGRTKRETHSDLYDDDSEKIELEGTPQKPFIVNSFNNVALYGYKMEQGKPIYYKGIRDAYFASELSPSFIVVNKKDTFEVPIETNNIAAIDDTCLWFCQSKNLSSYNFRTKQYAVFNNQGRDIFIGQLLRERVVSNERYFWFSLENALYCFDKLEKKYWLIYYLGKENIIKIKQIDDKILVFGQYKMLIATEQGWLSLKKDIIATKEVQKPLVDILYQELRDSTSGNKSILESIAILEKIKLKYQNSLDSAVQFRLKDLSGFIGGNDDEIKELIDNNTSIAANYKFKLYCDLIRSYTLLGRITLASDYHKKMQNEHFAQKDDSFEHNMAFVHQGRAKMDSIKQYPLSPDALLWAKANLIEDVLHGVDWNDGSYGDFWGDFTASNELYTQLYTQYPKSEFAGLAEWKIKGNCLGYDTCSPPSGSYECINFCKDFLRRYPNTKLKKEALDCIIENYAYLGDGEINYNLKEVREGIAFTEQAYREYPQLGDINKDYAYAMMKSNLALLAWELKATLNKTTYKQGEDIILNVSLLRNDAVKEGAEIEYKTNTPNCVVELNLEGHRCDGFFRENPYCPEVKYLKKTLNPGQKISEQCNLIKKVRHSDYMKDGLFLLPKGNYQMVVHWQELAKSEALNFIIE